jgi:FtsZ-binding cell division protein ZapB
LDTLAKLELRIGEIVAKTKELEKINSNLESRNEKLEADLKACRLELEQQKEKNVEFEASIKDKEVKVKDRISDLLGKLEQVEAEIV